LFTNRGKEVEKKKDRLGAYEKKEEKKQSGPTRTTARRPKASLKIFHIEATWRRRFSGHWQAGCYLTSLRLLEGGTVLPPWRKEKGEATPGQRERLGRQQRGKSPIERRRLKELASSATTGNRRRHFPCFKRREKTREKDSNSAKKGAVKILDITSTKRERIFLRVTQKKTIG